MKTKALDIYDDMPRAMRAYITNYGFHFNKRACEFAVSLMKKQNQATGKKEKIEPWTKDQVDEILAKNGVKLENAVMYDRVFVANMAKADYWKSSIEDEKHLALFVKDYLDDTDASNDVAFRRWMATMIGNGEPIEWVDLL